MLQNLLRDWGKGFRLLQSLLLAFLLLALPPAVHAAAAGRDKADWQPRLNATVFIYHRVGEAKYPTTNVSVERLKEQLAYLAANRYNVIPLSELIDALKNGQGLPGKTAVITFDDGYRSVYAAAWPLLRSYGFPFTVFLYVQAVDRGYPDFLTWEEVGEMKAAGVDFQDHSYSHHRLADWPAGMDEQAYRAWVSADLAKGFHVLQERLGYPPRFFAIPYGEYNSIVIEEAKKIGYATVLTQDPGSVSGETDPFLVPREPILGREWGEIEHFIEVLNRVDLPLKEVEPPLAPLSDERPARFGARVLHPERYRPDSFGIYVSELGWQQATLVGDHVYVENSRPLTRRLNRVMISAKEKESGRTALRFWLLMKH